MMTKSLVLALGLTLGLAAGAHAMSEWWTPVGRQCPTFDTEQSCENFCANNQNACGGSDQCEFRVGPQTPECSLPIPEN